MEKSIKECQKCCEFFSVEYFDKDRKSKDGRKRYCKSCISELNKRGYSKSSEIKKNKVLEWQNSNAEKVKEYKRNYAKRKRAENKRVN